MFESTTQCNFDEPTSDVDDEELQMELNDGHASTVYGSSCASHSSSFNVLENSEDVPDH